MKKMKTKSDYANLQFALADAEEIAQRFEDRDEYSSRSRAAVARVRVLRAELDALETALHSTREVAS